VSSGRYNSASEVVREALRIMEARDELQSLKLEQLRRDIRDGLNSGPARPWSVAEMKREGRKLLASRRSSAK
jgi:antitoxin ParD1/3/4